MCLFFVGISYAANGPNNAESNSAVCGIWWRVEGHNECVSGSDCAGTSGYTWYDSEAECLENTEGPEPILMDDSGMKPENNEQIRQVQTQAEGHLTADQVQAARDAQNLIREQARAMLIENLGEEFAVRTVQIDATREIAEGLGVKVMPETASLTAIDALEATFQSVEIVKPKTVGETHQYRVTARKSVRVLGLFETEMDVTADVDAETGEIVRTRKPWWSFLAPPSTPPEKREPNCVAEGKMGMVTAQNPVTEWKEGDAELEANTCCKGLTSISCDKPDADGECSEIGCVGAFYCTNCGDTICSEGENKCNCPEDCS